MIDEMGSAAVYLMCRFGICLTCFLILKSRRKRKGFMALFFLFVEKQVWLMPGRWVLTLKD